MLQLVVYINVPTPVVVSNFMLLIYIKKNSTFKIYILCASRTKKIEEKRWGNYIYHIPHMIRHDTTHHKFNSPFIFEFTRGISHKIQKWEWKKNSIAFIHQPASHSQPTDKCPLFWFWFWFKHFIFSEYFILNFALAHYQPCLLTCIINNGAIFNYHQQMQHSISNIKIHSIFSC